MPKLIFVNEGAQKMVVPLDAAVITVGRNPGHHLTLPGETVSANHASIVKVNRTYLVRDNGSANGTTVNGVKVDKERQLRDKDIVAFGNYQFRVELTDPPKAAAPRQVSSAPINKAKTQVLKAMPEQGASVPAPVSNLTFGTPAAGNLLLWQIGCGVASLLCLILIIVLILKSSEVGQTKTQGTALAAEINNLKMRLEQADLTIINQKSEIASLKQKEATSSSKLELQVSDMRRKLDDEMETRRKAEMKLEMEQQRTSQLKEENTRLKIEKETLERQPPRSAPRSPSTY
jgi:pSer/pThr/pTyr-binding forkhead associated (FHA) protein